MQTKRQAFGNKVFTRELAEDIAKMPAPSPSTVDPWWLIHGGTPYSPIPDEVKKAIGSY